MQDTSQAFGHLNDVLRLLRVFVRLRPWLQRQRQGIAR